MVDFSKIKTYPIKERKNKFKIADMLTVDKLQSMISNDSDEFKVLDNDDLRSVAERIKKARQNDKPVIVMMGAHAIKVGLSALIIDLMKNGFITHLATNGAVSIHDFELAFIGETSEDVGVTLEDGSFGMAEETGRYLNEAIVEAYVGSKGNDLGSNMVSGYGKAVGKKIEELDCPHKEFSLFYNAYKLGIPATVHAAIGTDIIHQHPACDGAALGGASYEDFKVLTESVSKLDGGVLVNIGSAVLMPEVFLKALTIARNLGCNVADITTANFDMIEHYRPRMNIVERPTSLGGKGYYIVEKHENTVPSLWKMLVA